MVEPDLPALLRTHLFFDQAKEDAAWCPPLPIRSEGGICRVRIFEQAGKVPIIIVTELTENTNTSITNLCEYLACEIIRAHFPERFEEHEPVLWIEHYVRSPAERDRLGLEYALVEFEDYTPRLQWLGGVQRLRIGQPSWKHVDRSVVEFLVGSLD